MGSITIVSFEAFTWLFVVAVAYLELFTYDVKQFLYAEASAS